VLVRASPPARASDTALRLTGTSAKGEADLVLTLVHWGGFLQCREKLLGAIWNGFSLIEDDILSAYILAIEVLVRTIVTAESGTRERDTREEPTGSRVGKNFGT
jgi:hypothetical protein